MGGEEYFRRLDAWEEAEAVEIGEIVGDSRFRCGEKMWG